MKRAIERELFAWKHDNQRLPLIIRGARQVGKSHIIEKFGRESFPSVVVVNFEFRPEFAKCLKI